MFLTKDAINALKGLVNVTDALGVDIIDRGEEIQIGLAIGTKSIVSDPHDTILDCVDDLTDFLDI